MESVRSMNSSLYESGDISQSESSEPKIRLPYQKPSLTFWSAEQLNGIEAKMSVGSGYGGGGGVTGSGKYLVHILFSAIWIDVPLLGFKTLKADHTALFVSSSNASQGYLYSYAPALGGLDMFTMLEKLVSGSPGYLSVSRNYNKGVAEVQYWTIKVNGNTYTGYLCDDETVCDYDDSRYYRAINFAVSKATAIGLIQYAKSCFGNGGLYHILSHNCCDKAFEILASQGITVRYNKSDNRKFVNNLINDIKRFNTTAAGLLAVSLKAMGDAIEDITIPNIVFDSLTGIKQNGVWLNYSTGPDFRKRTKR